jgi:hypothetical protein
MLSNQLSIIIPPLYRLSVGSRLSSYIDNELSNLSFLTSSLDTPPCYLVTTSLIALTAPQRSQREIATPDGDSGSYQLPSRQLELSVRPFARLHPQLRISGP